MGQFVYLFLSSVDDTSLKINIDIELKHGDNINLGTTTVLKLVLNIVTNKSYSSTQGNRISLTMSI